MRRPFVPFVLATALLSAGCGRDAPAAAQRAASPTFNTAMEFRGERPCVDCDGIEAWLRLEQEGEARRYRLVEHYRSGGRERQFEDAGEWQAEGDLLRLSSRTGGGRVYARLAGGALQARDAHGGPLPAAADELLVPVAFDTMR
jgi:hypothetical protein